MNPSFISTQASHHMALLISGHFAFSLYCAWFCHGSGENFENSTRENRLMHWITFKMSIPSNISLLQQTSRTRDCERNEYYLHLITFTMHCKLKFWATFPTSNHHWARQKRQARARRNFSQPRTKIKSHICRGQHLPRRTHTWVKWIKVKSPFMQYRSMCLRLKRSSSPLMS